MVVNDRTIRAKVVEQEDARRIARQKRAEGHRTALVEMERGNLFTLSLGNVQPDDVIVIRFAYFEELDAWQDELALQIPFNPGVRYIPGEPLLRSNSGRGATDDTDQVPDASRISPPRIDQMHPDAARLSLKGKLDGRDVDLCSISSPTHPTAVRPVAGAFEIFLPANAAVPDRDFVLRWRRAARPDLLSAAWISSDPEATYALIQLRAPDEVTVENREGSDIYFLVDRSGSMAGEKWAKTAEALIAFVNAAAQRDRVWITFFESDYRDFAEKPLERDALLRDRNFRSLAKIGTDGGTELLPALRHVLRIEQRYSTQRRSHVVLITDGQVGNEEAVLQAVSGHTLPVHCFGIDHAVNEAFLRQLAAQQRGTSVFLTPNDDLVRPIAILGSRLSRPVLTDLALDGGWELADTELPDIYAGQVAFASVRKQGRGLDINVTGRDAEGRPLTVSLEAQSVETNLPKLIWMKHRIESLLQAGKNREAIALAEKANLICRGAAFVAWDDAEKVAVAQDEVYQPSFHAEREVTTSQRRFIGAKSLSTRREPAFYELDDSSEGFEYLEARTSCRADDSTGSYTVDPGEKSPLIKRTCRAIVSAFWSEDAKKLTSILLDWAKHTDEKQVRDALSGLLLKCGRGRDATYLRKLLSDFFVALPDPWRTSTSAIFGAQPEQYHSP
jgi:Ca-activated chloride channel homolog